VAPSRKSATEERRRGLTLWNAVADCEADLVEALLLDRLDEKRATALKARYRRALTKGAPTQHDSVRRQLDFLLGHAVGERERFRKGLEIVLGAFPKE
jgi:hypothetical protein